VFETEDGVAASLSRQGAIQTVLNAAKRDRVGQEDSASHRGLPQGNSWMVIRQEQPILYPLGDKFTYLGSWELDPEGGNFELANGREANGRLTDHATRCDLRGATELAVHPEGTNRRSTRKTAPAG
jgi:hypothetical protein